MTTRLRAAIIGGGVGLSSYLPTLDAMSDIEVVGLLTHSKSHLIDDRIACDSADELISRDPDLLCITLPAALRDWEAVVNSQGSPKFIVEKPSALTVSDSARIIDTLGDRIARVFVAYQLRSWPPVEELQAIIKSGQYGGVREIRITQFSNVRFGGNIAQWRTRRHSGGGQLFEIGTHMVDLVAFLTGDDPMHAKMMTLNTSDYDPDSGFNVEQTFTARFTLGDVRCALHSSFCSSRERSFCIDIKFDIANVSYVHSGRAAYLDKRSHSGDERTYVDWEGGFSWSPPARSPVGSVFRSAFPGFIRRVVDEAVPNVSIANLCSLEHDMKTLGTIENLLLAEGVRGGISD